jgi:hypothetical protein
MTGRYYLEDSEINIARGLVHNASVRNIFGTSETMVANTGFIAVWEEDANYEYMSSANTLDLVSTDGGDTDVTVKLIGLDNDYNVIEEVVALDGANTVTTTSDFLRVNDLVTIGGNAVGDVTVTGDGTITVAKMLAGSGRNQAAIYTVPAGYNFYLTRINAFGVATTGGNPGAKVTAFRNFVQLANGVQLRVAEVDYNGEMEIMRVTPFKYSEKTDIQLQAKTYTDHATSIFAEGILIKE